MNEPRPVQDAPPPHGRIDMHCHLLPGVDDGCETFADAAECIGQLKAAGFVGSICTPHIWPDLLPVNTPEHIHAFVAHFQDELRTAGIDYHIWPGGEFRLFKDAINWMKEHGVPTLAQSRCVLIDHWLDNWPRWTDKGLRWLIDQGYRPILAHPERMPMTQNQPDKLNELIDMGVLLQGNFMSLTGEDGYDADKLVRQYLGEGKYQFMALDAHVPDGIGSRLDGMSILAREFGQDMLDRFTIEAPRNLILAPPPDGEP